MKIFFIAAFAAITFASCSECVECNGTSFCEDANATYTNLEGEEISWDEYAAMIEMQCP